MTVPRVQVEQAAAGHEKDKLIGQHNCLPLLLAGDKIGSAAQLSDTRVTLPSLELLIGLAWPALGQRRLNVGNVRANEFGLIGQQLVSIDYPRSIYGAQRG